MRRYLVLLTALVMGAAGDLPGQEFTIALDAPAVVLSPIGEVTRYSVTGLVNSSDVPTEQGIEAWSIGVTALRGAIIDATTAGTLAADVRDDPPGIRTRGFELTELTLGEGNKGAVSSVVLSYQDTVSLPLDGPSEVLKLTVEVSSPEIGCVEAKVLYVDGLQGSAQPVENKLVYLGRAIHPALVEAPTDVCSLPQIDVSSSSLDFGETLIGSTSSLGVTVANVGNAPLDVTNVLLLEDASPEFTLQPASPGDTLPPGTSIDFRVLYTPIDEGIDSGSLAIESSDAETPTVTVPISGSGVTPPAPEIDVSPPLLEFGEVLVGSASTLSVTVGNTGNADLEISSVGLDPATSADFVLLSGTEGGTVFPGTSISVDVRYAPSDEGSDTGSLRIESDGGDTVTSVPLSGSGILVGTPEVRVSPLSLDYLEILVGSSRSFEVTIANAGTALLEVTSVMFGDGTGADFRFAREPPSGWIAPGAQVPLRVTYAPSEVTSHIGSLVIESSDAVKPRVTVSLTGRGSSVPSPHIRVSPHNLDFGEVLVGTSRSLGVDISNPGSAPLEISETSLDDSASDAFAVASGPPAISLAPGANFALQVEYTPPDDASHTSMLRIAREDAGAPLLVSLSGRGSLTPSPEIESSTLALDFGDVLAGGLRSLEVTIANTGSEMLEVRSISLGPATSESFRQTGGPESAVIDPGGSIVLEVTYAPEDASIHTGTLRLESNDSDEIAVVVSLSGRGVPDPLPAVEAAPTSLDFGSVPREESATLAVVVRNPGTAALALENITLGPGTAPEYAIASAPGGAGIPPDDSIAIDVTYGPTDLGYDTGTLRIETDAPGDEVVVVSLLGMGAENPGPPFRRGDASGEGLFDLTDVINTFEYIFLGGTKPRCLDAADSNDDGRLDIGDGIYSLLFLFLDGEPLPMPGSAECGLDPTQDSFEVCRYSQILCLF